jgi:putative heme iron utilization protein
METPKSNAAAAARNLLAAGGAGALSVIDMKSGHPFTTLVNVAVDAALRPLILISGLSHHTQCLKADPRASLMLHEELPAHGDPLTALRVTVTGNFSAVPAAEAASAFLARHPYSELYAGLGDFAFWRMEPVQAHIIAGFGRAYSMRYADVVAR